MEKKTMSTKKKLAILAGIIAVIFIGVNLAWFIGVWMPYNNYTENMTPLNDGTRYYMYTDDKYDYYVKKPFYLNFNASFFRVEDKGGFKVYFDEDGNQLPLEDDFISLFIWPEFNGKGYLYGISCERQNGIYVSTINFKINEELEIISLDVENLENNEMYRQILEKNYDQISAMMKNASEFWRF